jgi:hypothetical protein
LVRSLGAETVGAKNDFQIFPKLAKSVISKVEFDIKFMPTRLDRNGSIAPQICLLEAIAIIVITIVELHLNVIPKFEIRPKGLSGNKSYKDAQEF